MMKAALLLTLFITLACSQEFVGMHEELQVPIFKFQIDSDPYTKFQNVTEHFKVPANKVFDDFLGIIPQPIHWLFRFGVGAIKKAQPVRYEEIRGIAKVIGRPTWEVVMANYAYEMSAFCTSIIVKQANGTLIHGRNLDFSFADDMKKVTY